MLRIIMRKKRMMRKTSVLFVTAALAIVAWSCSRMELTPEFSGPEAAGGCHGL